MNDIDKIRQEIREMLLDIANEREAQAKEADREDNVLFSENLKGKADGLRDAYYLVDNYLKKLGKL